MSENVNFIEEYREVSKGRDLRGIIRHGALNALSAFNPIISTKTNRIQFLYFHHVFLDEIENLEKLLKRLSIHHQFIPYSEAIHRIQTNQIDGNYITWSSDDGFKNNLAAAQVFRRFNISACFFVNPSSIGINNPADSKQFCRARLNLPPVEFLNWEDVNELQNEGHEIGSHTINHLRLTELNNFQLHEEVVTSKSLIEKHCGEIQHFAYPYGRWSDFNQRGMSLVREAGYKSCATAERGCHTAGTRDMTAIPIIQRDLVIAGWPQRHIEFFMHTNMLYKKNIASPWK